MHAWLAFILGVFVTVGIVLIVAGVSGATYYGLAIQAEIALAITLFVIAVIVALIFYAGVKAQFKRVETGKEALIGAAGIATSDLKPNGEVRVNGEFWQATVKDATIAAGQPVLVVGMEGMFLVVQPTEQKA